MQYSVFNRNQKEITLSHQVFYLEDVLTNFCPNPSKWQQQTDNKHEYSCYPMHF